MEGETSRRQFIRGGSLATAGLLSVAANSEAQESAAHQGHAAHEQGGDYPRDRPSPGGPVGSPTDRGKLVPGLRNGGEPPVPVVAPDIPERVPFTLKDGVKEFVIYCRHTRREFLPDLYIDGNQKGTSLILAAIWGKWVS